MPSRQQVLRTDSYSYFVTVGEAHDARRVLDPFTLFVL
jgi:hypothetical protein